MLAVVDTLLEGDTASPSNTSYVLGSTTRELSGDTNGAFVQCGAAGRAVGTAVISAAEKAGAAIRPAAAGVGVEIGGVAAAAAADLLRFGVEGGGIAAASADADFDFLVTPLACLRGWAGSG